VRTESLEFASTRSPGHGVHRLLEVGHELRRQQAPGRRMGVGLGARRCKVWASNNLGGRLRCGVRHGPVGVFSGQPGWVSVAWVQWSSTPRGTRSA
jgi:hypothetical protein